MALGSLSRRTVLGRDGAIQMEKESKDLVGLIWSAFDKVRCLDDGRIVFSSGDIHLPSTDADMPRREQLFVLDSARQSTLTRLIPYGIQDQVPAITALFELSPDRQKICLADEKTFVVMNTSAGTIEVISNATDVGDTVPGWRNSNELCFLTDPDTNAPKTLQVALWSSGKTRVISSNWPAEVREKFLDK